MTLFGRAGANVRELAPADAAWAHEFLESHAGSARMVSRGRLHRCDRLPGFYAEEHGRRTALLTYRFDAGEMEVVTIHSAEPGRGYGTALLEAALTRARERGCRRLWLITTNDNAPAIGFYIRRGMRLVAVHLGAVDAARRELKPEIPLRGLADVAIRDEIELELDLQLARQGG